MRAEIADPPEPQTSMIQPKGSTLCWAFCFSVFRSVGVLDQRSRMTRAHSYRAKGNERRIGQASLSYLFRHFRSSLSASPMKPEQGCESHFSVTVGASGSMSKASTYAACHSYVPPNPCAKSRPHRMHCQCRIVTPSCLIVWAGMPSDHLCVCD